ncbi:MAG: T9SS type A sorting domain-containing protein [Bacteroidia bacterium]|nr:T9SS type A sorting domain-containing protein [Bacteroidia bacterium]
MKIIFAFISFSLMNINIFSQSTVCFSNDPLNYCFPTNTSYFLNMSSGLIDDDSIPDLVFTHFSKITINKGLGGGYFDLLTTFNFTSNIGVPLKTWCQDMDGDNRDDILISTNSDLVIIWNDSSGYLSGPTLLSNLVGSDFILMEKFDTNLFHDIVAVKNSSYHFFRNNGNRTFTDSLYTLPFTGVKGVALSKVNSDNLIDLTFLIQGNPNIVKTTGNGDGTFSFYRADPTTALRNIFSADFNNDGYDDNLCVGLYSIYIFFNDSTGAISWTDTLYYTDLNLIVSNPLISIEYVNNDSLIDIIALNTDKDNVTIYLNQGTAGFSINDYALNSGPSNINYRDFNNDGLKDIITYHNEDNSYSILIGKANGSFEGTEWITGSMTSSSETLDFAISDLNHDGWMDFVCSALLDSIYTYINNGNGSFTRTGYYTQITSLGISLSDFNYDGNVDAALLSPTQVAIMNGNSLGGFTLSQIFNIGVSNISIVTADIERDSFPEILIGDQQNIKIIYNHSGTLLPTGQINGTNGHTRLAVSDLNSDGFPDIIANDHYSGLFQIINNPSGGNFSVLPIGNTCISASYERAAPLDFDGDGHMDIVIGNRGTCSAQYEIFLFRNLGNGQFGNQIGVAIVDFPVSIAVSDLNLDSLPDLVIPTSHNLISVLLNSGGTFSFNQIIKAGGTPQNSIIADFNNDHRPDVAMTNSASRDISILYNGMTKMNVTDNFDLCQGDTLRLYLVDPAPTVTWFPPNIIADTLLVTTGGTYLPVAVNIGECIGTKSLNIVMRNKPIVNFIPLPLDSICDTSSAITLTATPTGGIFYGPGVMGNNFSPNGLVQGSYTLNYILTNNFHCTTIEHDTIFVINCGNTVNINPIIKDESFVAPNPFTEQLYVHNADNIYFVEIMDYTGRILWKKELCKQNNLTLELINLNKGMYLINLYTTDYGVSQHKIVKAN